MTTLALTLILVSALLHATWNLFVKRVNGGLAFTWLFIALAALVYAPLGLGLLLWQRPHIAFVDLVFILASALLHIAYYLALGRGYRNGDFSLVYPVARGSGPLLATAAAVLLLGERPTPLALAGMALIGGGVLALAGNLRALWRAGAGPGLAYALLTGFTIAAYTLTDKYVVGILLIPPLLLDWGTNVIQTLALAPLAFRRRNEVVRVWQAHRLEALGVALLNPLAYILVLTALSFTPVSYIAPAREISILVGTGMGARLLAEGNVVRRLAAACAMVVGLITLALG